MRTSYPAVSARMAAGSSFTMGTSNAGFPVPGSDIKREVYRFVGGVEGTFGLLERNWNWNAYYQHGETKAHEELTNTWKNARTTLAPEHGHRTGSNILCRFPEGSEDGRGGRGVFEK